MTDLVIDQYSGFDHKDLAKVGKLPSYLDDDTKRRRKAYRAIEAYRETVVRELLPADGQHKEDELQEFGDVAVLIERVATAVLGGSPTIGVIGADAQVPDIPDLPDKPQRPEPAADEDPRITAVEERRYEAAVARWVERSQEVLDEYEQLVNDTPRLLARQNWLQQWAIDDRLIGRLQENETENIVGLGDGVVSIGWDPVTARPTTEIHDPHSYVPVLTSKAPTEFPDVVHLVWDYKDKIGDEEIKYVRRVTYELVPVEEVEEFQQALYLTEGQRQTHVCLHTDATWLEKDFEDVYNPGSAPIRYEPLGVGNGDDETEPVELNRYNTGYDFIPVVHFPNTLSTKYHFGRSLITRLAQLLDEISASDTDESLSTRWAARPPMVIAGLGGDQTTIDMSPGKGVRGDKVSTVDLAANLGKIMDRNVGLQKRLSVNSQVPDGLRGRVDASDVPSGLALTLSFTPFVQLIGRLREARSAKYPLLLKFVQRIAIQNGDESGIDSTQVEDAEIRFGAFMPQDLLGQAEIMARLFVAGLISLETALLELQAAGLTIDDLQAEIASIRAADGETALAIAEATGSSQAAIDFMGIDARPEGIDPDGPVLNTEGALVGAGAAGGAGA